MTDKYFVLGLVLGVVGGLMLSKGIFALGLSDMLTNLAHAAVLGVMTVVAFRTLRPAKALQTERVKTRKEMRHD